MVVMLIAQRLRAAIDLTLILLLLILLGGCENGTADNVAEYMQWLGDPEHGLMQSRSINGLRVTAKYLPPEYQAYQRIKGGEETSPDDLLKECEKYETVMLSFGFEGRSGDVMLAGIGSYQEFSERALELNFNMGEYVSLVTDGGTSYKPVLATLDNTYGLAETRNVVLVFVDEHHHTALGEAKTLDLIYNDNVFNTGVHHFVFSRDAIDNRMKLDLQNLTINRP